MKILDIPFNQFIGICNADKPEFILMLKENPDYLNHIGTVHASAQFALAEASSGKYLLERFKDISENIIPVVRRVEVKYSKPATGRLYSSAEVSDGDDTKVRRELEKRGRTMVSVEVNIINLRGEVTMKSSFEWFIQGMQK
jgi:acyl-coenzyme A thioesterase PaaI-like protein